MYNGYSTAFWQESQRESAEDAYDEYLRDQDNRDDNPDPRDIREILVTLNKEGNQNPPLAFEPRHGTYHFTHTMQWDGSADQLLEIFHEVESHYRHDHEMTFGVELRTDTLDLFHKLETCFEEVLSDLQPFYFMDYYLGEPVDTSM